MDEHMMAAEIAALKNEIETLKRQIELLGYDIDTYKMTLKAHKEVIERLNNYTHPTCKTCGHYYQDEEGCHKCKFDTGRIYRDGDKYYCSKHAEASNDKSRD